MIEERITGRPGEIVAATLGALRAECAGLVAGFEAEVELTLASSPFGERPEPAAALTEVLAAIHVRLSNAT